MPGSIEPVSITYGVAPARRGTIRATTSVAPIVSMTIQDRTSPTQRNAPRNAELDFVTMSPLSDVQMETITRRRSDLRGGDREVVQDSRQIRRPCSCCCRRRRPRGKATVTIAVTWSSSLSAAASPSVHRGTFGSKTGVTTSASASVPARELRVLDGQRRLRGSCRPCRRCTCRSASRCRPARSSSVAANADPSANVQPAQPVAVRDRQQLEVPPRRSSRRRPSRRRSSTPASPRRPEAGCRRRQRRTRPWLTSS